MGKSVPSPSRLENIFRIIRSERANLRPFQVKSVSAARPGSLPAVERVKLEGVRIESAQHQLRLEKKMEVGNSTTSSEGQRRMPLAEVVTDCVQRWFRETLKEAKAGDSAMQVLVGQMYNSGYGVARNAKKGKAWIDKASKSRLSVWEVGEKHPGYNASDSDSDDTKIQAT